MDWSGGQRLAENELLRLAFLRVVSRHLARRGSSCEVVDFQPPRSVRGEILEEGEEGVIEILVREGSSSKGDQL